MIKLILYTLSTLLFVSTVNAQTYTCNTYTLFQGDSNGQYYKIDNSVPSFSTIIETSNDVIKVYVQNNKSTYTEFWKDLYEYRNYNGTITQRNSEFEIKTIIEDPSSSELLPVKIKYHCK